MKSQTLLLIGLAVLLLLAGVAAVMAPRWLPSRVTQNDVRVAILSTLQEEADTTFLVTGYLDIATRITAEDTRVFFPGTLDLPLGTTRATVQVPGRVSYGFDLGALDPQEIWVRGDTIEMEVPELAIYSVEPRVEEAQIETERGWTRLPASERTTERLAMSHMSESLRRQAEAHLVDSVQPQVNTAEALRRLVTPILVSVGVEAPVFRIYIGESLVLQ